MLDLPGPHQFGGSSFIVPRVLQLEYQFNLVVSVNIYQHLAMETANMSCVPMYATYLARCGVSGKSKASQ